MAQSLPSKRICIADVPEVERFGADFIYNFFTPDEQLNDSGNILPEFAMGVPAANFDAVMLDSANFNRFIPRYIRFSWKPTSDKTTFSEETVYVSISEFLSKIHNEETFITDEYTNYYFQDTGLDEKLDFFIKRALDEVRKHVNPERPESPLDILNYLKTRLSSDIKQNFLLDAFLSYSKEGHLFLDENNKEQFTNKILERLTKVQIKAQLNNLVLYDLLKSTKENVLNIFDDEAFQILGVARRKQNKTRTEKNSAIMDGRDYDFEILDIVNYRPIDTAGFKASANILGYIIDKWEYTGKGTSRKLDSIIVESPWASTTIDTKVRYGTTYAYTIRSIAIVDIVAEDLETNEVGMLTFLLSSRPSERQVISTIERIPPPPPADFKIAWDYRKKAARIIWSFPVNPQRDIKQFQLFRRKSIRDPFELIKQYNFDDSMVVSPYHERPDPNLVERLKGPKSYYVDFEFTRESKFIYAVCSIDAHGYSSNYSYQLECKFNKLKNKMEERMVSVAGAPKPYPNMFLNEDAFVDTIRDSGHSEVEIIFDPEYLSVTDHLRNDLRLLRTSDTSKYRLQLINVDLQEEANIDIKLTDLRTTDSRRTR